MTFHSFIIRLVLVALFTWVVGSIIESFAWALYCGLYMLGLYEVLRPGHQPTRRHQQTPGASHKPPTQRLP